MIVSSAAILPQSNEYAAGFLSAFSAPMLFSGAEFCFYLIDSYK